MPRDGHEDEGGFAVAGERDVLAAKADAFCEVPELVPGFLDAVGLHASSL